MKDPTVWPLGLGGKEGSRGGPGFFFLSRNSLKAPPRMVPPFFSSAVICMCTWVSILNSRKRRRRKVRKNGRKRIIEKKKEKKNKRKTERKKERGKEGREEGRKEE